MPVSSWSKNPDLNGDADIASGIDFREDVVLTGDLNNSFRAFMAEIKKGLVNFFTTTTTVQHYPSGMLKQSGRTAPLLSAQNFVDFPTVYTTLHNVILSIEDSGSLIAPVEGRFFVPHIATGATGAGFTFKIMQVSGTGIVQPLNPIAHPGVRVHWQAWGNK